MEHPVDRALKRVPLLSREEERALIVLAKTGDIKARNKLVESNLRFAMQLVRKYKSHTRDHLYDLLNEAAIGLSRAIESFDLSKDVKLISYAVWWMRQKINMYISEDELVHIPNNVKTRDLRYRRVNHTAIALGKMPEHHIEEYPQIGRLEIASDSGELIQNSALLALIDFDSASTDLDSQMREDVHKNLIELALDGVSERNRIITLDYYQKCKTYQMISEEHGMSRERVRQIVVQTVKKMKANNLRFGLHKKYEINL